ncbi:RTA1-domain-containing protein [Thozetella sp. PMI_491]|nr:RTA1-domain-containing protein [Thozetella sp. PMI_491]
MCENVRSFYEYRLSLPANALFLALFILSFLGFVGAYGATRRGLAFTIALLLGVLCEILGYAGRVMSWKNQWQENGFLIQICCLTIGPAFMAAGIYLCLRRIVAAFGPENSRIAPEWYTRLFIPCDVISLVLQATGGGMASVASHNNKSVDTGDNIMIAGLSFQVVTLLAFMAVSADFALNAYRRHRQLGEAAFDQTEEVRRVRNSRMFKGFLAALLLSTICIFWRSVFRVAELSRGWSGPLMKRQDLFIGFEGVMVIVACLVLNIFNPVWCIRPLLEGAGGLGSKRQTASKTTETVGKAEPVSDGTATP